MSQLLPEGEAVWIGAWNQTCIVETLLGGGGQGEVYRCTVDGRPFALKWYSPGYLAKAPRLRERLERAIREGPPSDRFLWPLEMAGRAGSDEFGYIMQLREPRFRGIKDLLATPYNHAVAPNFRSLATIGFELADGYLLLHTQKGLCYRDINYNNVFFDPEVGEVRICDNDNVDINGQPGEIGGTPSFMAPELVRLEAMPSIETDRYSLAVLLFYLFMIGHPLDGKLESSIHSMDDYARRKLYGTDPVFIFDPDNDRNRPDPGVHKHPLARWPIYPSFLRELFTRAFTSGLRDPANGRVFESEWRGAMIRLRDSIQRCPDCHAENFFDPEVLRVTGRPSPCWNCRRELPLPFRMRLNKAVVVLNPGKQLYPHHLNPQRLYDFSAPMAEVVKHPTQPDLIGLKNLSGQNWTFKGTDQQIKEIAPSQTCRLASGASVHFGTASGEIRQ
jgi:DNA-binding helix-hairpin-helix protein with protein kinase domain